MSGFISSFPTGPLELPPPQPHYPQDDLDPSAIPYLDAMLASEAEIAAAHDDAERQSRLFLMGHAVISRLAVYSNALSDDHARLAGIGAAHYEAVSKVIEGYDLRPYHLSVAAPTALQKFAASGDLTDEHYLIKERFERSMPHLRDFIERTLMRSPGISSRTVDYALVGTALQHRTERQALTTQTACEFEDALGIPRTLGEYDTDESI